MSNKNEHKISPVAVIIVCVMISFTIVSGLFFLQTDFLPENLRNRLPNLPRIPNITSLFNGRMSVEELLTHSRPKEALALINSLPAAEQNSDSLLYLKGRAWYLAAWQRYEDDRWRSYARNANDWFVGTDVDNALHFLLRASQSERTFAQSMSLIGSIYMDKGWFERAKNVFENVLRHGPHRESHLNFGITLSRMRRPQDAARVLKMWNGYETDPDFVRNLFFLYAFNIRDYAEAARLGDLFLAVAPRGHFDVPKVRRELRDLAARFPEHFNDDMIIMRDRPPEFRARHRAR